MWAYQNTGQQHRLLRSGTLALFASHTPARRPQGAGHRSTVLPWRQSDTAVGRRREGGECRNASKHAQNTILHMRSVTSVSFFAPFFCFFFL
ncbi:hypothetical protein FKM82_025650 [Ascaphus truei]